MKIACLSEWNLDTVICDQRGELISTGSLRGRERSIDLPIVDVQRR